VQSFILVKSAGIDDFDTAMRGQVVNIGGSHGLEDLLSLSPSVLPTKKGRELLSTTQNFEVPGGTLYSLQQVAGPPPAQVMSGGPTGNFLRLATTPSMPTASMPGNDNVISFATSDPGTYNQATASWDFRVTTPTPQGGSGVGMSFALLNTAKTEQAPVMTPPVQRPSRDSTKVRLPLASTRRPTRSISA
jgi:hypothetical protein